MILTESCLCLHQISLYGWVMFSFFLLALKRSLQREVGGGSPAVHKAEHCNYQPSSPWVHLSIFVFLYDKMKEIMSNLWRTCCSSELFPSMFCKLCTMQSSSEAPPSSPVICNYSHNSKTLSDSLTLRENIDPSWFGHLHPFRQTFVIATAF